MTSPNLTNVVWVKTILYSYRHIRPKKVKYPIPEIPDDSENKSGMDWVLPKIIGSGRVSGTRQALLNSQVAVSRSQGSSMYTEAAVQGNNSSSRVEW